MDLTVFGIDNGYVEAKLRGYRSAFLKAEHYAQLKNFNSLEEVYQYLQTETDYGEYIDGANVSINSLKTSMKKKLSDELDYIEINCMRALSQFIFYIRATYMIDNVMNILEGLRSGTSFKRLIAACDPIGYFPELNAIEIASNDIAVLYETVLIDTPLCNFFSTYLESNTKDLKNFNEVQTFFKEEKAEKVRSSLKRILMEEFYDFCKNLNQTSADSMLSLLSMEADFKTMQIVYNSLEDPKDDRIKTRETLCPSIGELYPLHYHLLKNVETLDEMRDVVKGFINYRNILATVPEPNKIEETFSKTLEDFMYEEEVKTLSNAFDEQCNLAIFYAYVKLKEQEIRNIVWYAEMISRKLEKNDPNWKKIIIPFSDE
jgi:V-type H+-transporting ATPase subunit d